ncbi:hypothetical protein FRB99_001007 [Tulasnella sp. 403]|nr:hypothetical protein FRB99_001007 [Tulasnella sp. 403]
MPQCKDCYLFFPRMTADYCPKCQKVAACPANGFDPATIMAWKQCRDCGVCGARIQLLDGEICGGCMHAAKTENETRSAVDPASHQDYQASVMQSQPQHSRITAREALAAARSFAQSNASSLRLTKKPAIPPKSAIPRAIVSSKRDLRDIVRSDHFRVTWTTTYLLPGEGIWRKTGITSELVRFKDTERMSEVVQTIRQRGQADFETEIPRLQLEQYEIATQADEYGISCPAIDISLHSGVLRSRVTTTDELLTLKEFLDNVGLTEKELKRGPIPFEAGIKLAFRAESPLPPPASDSGYSAEVGPSHSTRAAKRRCNKSNLRSSPAKHAKRTPPSPAKAQATSTEVSMPVPFRLNVPSLFSPVTLYTLNVKETIKYLIRDDLDGEILRTTDKATEIHVNLECGLSSGCFKCCLSGMHGQRQVAVLLQTSELSLSKVGSYERSDAKQLLEAELKGLTVIKPIVDKFNNLNPNKQLRLAVNVDSDTFVADFGMELKLSVGGDLTPFMRYALVEPLLGTWPTTFTKFSSASGQMIDWSQAVDGPQITMIDYEALSELLGAFTHFVWVCSNHSFVIADIQGYWDAGQRVFTMADLQLHTSPDKTSNWRRLTHWDSGQNGIYRVFEEHKCNRDIISIQGKEGGFDIRQVLEDYNRRGIDNRQTIVDLLRTEHDIIVSTSTISRLRADFGIYASRGQASKLSTDEVRQCVVDQLDKDPGRKHGPRTIKQLILEETGVAVPRDLVDAEMHFLDPEGFALRAPGSKKVHYGVIVVLGPNAEWSGDGYDKLIRLGFPFWALRDVWSGLWIGIWAVPNNRKKKVIAYLYLKAVVQCGGIPLQSTTDRGSETVELFGCANVLRDIFAPDLQSDELPAHRFLKSINNITIERGWRQLRENIVENIALTWQAGEDRYIETNVNHFMVARWLWAIVIQKELEKLRVHFNDRRTRYQKKKAGPSGVAPSIAYALPGRFGGQQCLIPVDIPFVKQMMEELGGEDLIRFVPASYEEKATTALASLGLTTEALNLQNIWDVFSEVVTVVEDATDEEVDFAVRNDTAED